MLKKNQITYRNVGDYNIPNFTLPPEKANIKTRECRLFYKDHIMKHNKLQIGFNYRDGVETIPIT